MHCVRVSSARLAEYIKELKCAEGIVELVSMREFSRTREKCGEVRAKDECFSHFSSVLKNSQVLIELNNA